MKIVKNYKTPEDRMPAGSDPAKYVVSPITGELVSTSEMEKHMHISLIDPMYKEQKERKLAKIKETTLARDDEISRSIVDLARARPDIFGTTEEEVSNAVKAGTEKKKDEQQPKQVMCIGGEAEQFDASIVSGTGTDPLPWTGMHFPGPPQPFPLISVPQFTPNPMPYHIQPLAHHIQDMMPIMRKPPPPRQQQMIRMPGPMGQFMLCPPWFSMPPPPHMQTMINPIGIPQHPQPPAEEQQPRLLDEPEPKRQRTEAAPPIPAEQFLAQHPGSARISVSIPNRDDGNLRGQVLEISVQSLLETVGSLKEQIAGELQLPANKQKLSVRTSFLKDNLSLAYYNVGTGVLINLAPRERGGRKI